VSEPAHLDGNTLGGLLGELFAVDLTTATTTCATCSAVRALAELHLYLDAPGAVARCATCGNVQVRLVRSDHHYWLDLTGARLLTIPREAPPS
jgi:hypothetical protein